MTSFQGRKPLDLQAIRHAAGLSQTGLSKVMQFRHRSTVANIEARNDWYLSSLIHYITAAGGTAELVVKINNQELRFKLAEGI